MKSITRMHKTLHHEEPDLVPDGNDIEWVLGAEDQMIIKSGHGFRVWRDNFGGVHVDISHALVSDLDSKVKDIPIPPKHGRSRHIWWYTVAPAVRFPEDLDLIEPPTLSAEKLAFIKKKTKELHDKGLFVVTGHHGVFDVPWRQLRGFKQWLIDCIKSPAFAKKVVEYAAKPVMEIDNTIIEEAGVDAVHITGDQGTPEGPFLPPACYKEIIYPWHRRLAQSFHKRGAFFFIHSHGYLMPIMDYMIDAGFDMINPVSPLCRMNLAEMKEKYGDKVTLSADITIPMERGTAPNKPGPKIDTYAYDKIYYGNAPIHDALEALEYTIKTGAPGGGFFFAGGGLPGSLKQIDYESSEYAQRTSQQQVDVQYRQAYLRAWKKLRRYPTK